MNNNRTMKKQKNIAFIASENKKSELIEWSYFNRDLLLNHEITAIGCAITILEGTLNKTVNKLISGPLGGYTMLAEMIADGKIDVLVFFASDEIQHKDFEVLMESVKNNNVIISFNKSTADFIFHSPLMNKEYFVKKPSPFEQKPERSYTRKNRLKAVAQVKAA